MMKYRLRILVMGTLFFVSGLLFAQEKYDMVVAADGSGDFNSVQKAIDACRIFPDKPFTIHLKNGVYHEKIAILRGNTHLRIIGENVEKTIIVWDDYFNKINRGRNSTFYTYTLKVEPDDFRMENVTVENSAGPVGQAVALHVEGDRCIFSNCRFLGNQDTVFADGNFSRQYFYNCYIEGTTDFIFGGATALFENCHIQSKSNSFITAASTPQGKPCGFVFLKSKITAAAGVDKVYLGRPWRGYAKVAFINCEMGDFIAQEGWDNWSDAGNEKTARFAEYGNTGPGALLNKRVSWSRSLTESEASVFNKAAIFAPLGWEIRTESPWYDLTRK